MFEVWSLPAVGCSAFGVILKTSNMLHEYKGHIVFCAHLFRVEEIIWYFYGDIVYMAVAR